jgi:lipopolysaccharide transport system ATP-binding protein
VARKFDEIVAFAEVEQFIDTPVKHYSSGMHLRLAFAVAAHLEPEILLVDEVLAVGDVAFQEKCLGRMRTLSTHGRTVLFVSHSMSAIQQLCSRAILLANGRLDRDGQPAAVVSRYLQRSTASSLTREAASDRPAITEARATWIASGVIQLEVDFVSPRPLTPPVLGVVLNDANGLPVFGTNARFEPQSNLPRAMQQGSITVSMSSRELRDGRYYLSLWLGDHHQDYCTLERALAVDVGEALTDALRPPLAALGSVKLATSWSYVDRN